MSRFVLKEKTFKIRDMEVTVRELTQKQRNEFTTKVNEDRFQGPAILASLGTVSPAMTVDEAAEEPAEVIEEIVAEIMALSGMGKQQKKADAG